MRLHIFEKYVLVFSVLIIFLGFTGSFFNHVNYYRLNGSSMYPTIKDGQVYRCVENFETLEKGDIISFKDSTVNHIITHRIHKVKSNGLYRTKGDNNQNFDRFLVNRSEIICKVKL